MNKKDIVILLALMNTLMEQDIDIKQCISEDKREKFIKIVETKFPQLIKDKNIKEEWIKTLEKYIDKIN